MYVFIVIPVDNTFASINILISSLLLRALRRYMLQKYMIRTILCRLKNLYLFEFIVLYFTIIAEKGKIGSQIHFA